MKHLIVICLSFAFLFAQTESQVDIDEVADPDEQHFTDKLIQDLFGRFASDSSGGAQNKLVIRQRLQYSPSLEGWRLLNKGRVQSEYTDLIFLSEQDPGEFRLTDHSVFTLSSHKQYGFEQLILGDYKIAWGAGLTLNQKSSRLSLNPGSIAGTPRLSLSPHYSTRETNYFRGIASKWKIQNLQGLVFISKRQMQGNRVEGIFKEDSDGIHPSGKDYDESSARELGLAGVYSVRGLDIFFAALQSSQLALRKMELGLHWSLGLNQSLQVYLDHIQLSTARSIIAWSYKTGSLQLALRYQYFPRLNFDSFSEYNNLLGSQMESEGGLSLRLLVRPSKLLTIRYALDEGSAIQVNSLRDMRKMLIHKAQLQLRQSNRQWQLDMSNREEGPIIPRDIWSEVVENSQISKLALSLYERINPAFNYRINVKTARDQDDASWLVQQSVIWSKSTWKVALGYTRYFIPDYRLRMSIYETGLLESFNFFTAFEDGQRWFGYIRYQSPQKVNLELSLSQTAFDSKESKRQSPQLNFQMSIVL